MLTRSTVHIGPLLLGLGVLKHIPVIPGQSVQVGIHPSKVVVTKLKLGKDRNEILARKDRTATDKSKGKVTEAEVAK